MGRYSGVYFRYFLTLVFFFASVLGIFAEDIQPQESVAERNYKLTLEEASRLALANSFDIQLAKYDAKIAETKKPVAVSIYDTFFNAEIKYKNDQSKQTTTLAGTKAIDNDYNVGFSKKLPIGTTLDVDMTNNRHWSNSPFVTSSPSHDSALGLTIAQELGKNFLGIQDRADIKITQIDIENSRYSSLDKIEASLSDIQRAYWELALAAKVVEIETEMVKQAEKLFLLHQEKIKSGLTELPEALASEANYKTRISELFVAENTVNVKSNALKLLLNLPQEDIFFVAADDLVSPMEQESAEQSLRLAFDNRRDYKSTASEIKAKGIALSMKKNNLWPEINLKASLTRNGIGDHFKQAVEQISDEDNPELLATLIVSFSLENSKARAELKSSQLQKAKAILEMKLLERKIMIHVTDDVKTCNMLFERSQNQQEIAELQRQKLREEEKRFERGRSDTDTLIRYQEDFLRAQKQAAQAAFDYRAAAIDLRKKEGMLLNAYWEGEI